MKMMKNRDTASNPYRVPRQPTAKWIKVAIVGLLFSNVALIGGVVFLILSTEECTRTCYIDKAQTKLQPLNKDDIIPRDQAQQTISVQQDNIQWVTERVDTVEENLGDLYSSIIRVEEMCKKSSTAAARTTADNLPEGDFIPQPPGDFEKLASMRMEITKLNAVVKEHIKNSQQLCETGHYRYGMHCYYVGDGKISQANAKRFCAEDYGAKGTLVIITNKFIQEFLATKLPNPMHSYWIGIEKAQRSRDSSISQRNGSNLKQRRQNMAPSPLVLSSNQKTIPHNLSTGNEAFDYVDGTRVQNKVWSKWEPRRNPHDEQQKDCVGLSYDKTDGAWYWKHHNCGARLGYVCQYFIMGIGY